MITIGKTHIGRSEKKICISIYKNLHSYSSMTFIKTYGKLIRYKTLIEKYSNKKIR